LADAVQGGDGAIDLYRLLFGAHGEVLRGGLDFLRAGADRLSGFHHAAHGCGNGADRAVKALAQAFVISAEWAIQTVGQIALREFI
jgi:hypothetical protein